MTILERSHCPPRRLFRSCYMASATHRSTPHHTTLTRPLHSTSHLPHSATSQKYNSRTTLDIYTEKSMDQRMTPSLHRNHKVWRIQNSISNINFETWTQIPDQNLNFRFKNCRFGTFRVQFVKPRHQNLPFCLVVELLFSLLWPDFCWFRRNQQKSSP